MFDPKDADITVPRTKGDEALVVSFFQAAVHCAFRSMAEGRPIYETKTFIKIMVPGDFGGDAVHEVTDEYKMRFPLQWARYNQQLSNGGGDGEVGTPLGKWGILQPHMVAELLAMNFRTVESIAAASDSAIGTIGNVAGMSGTALRDKARLFINAMSAVPVAPNAEVEKLATENKVLTTRLVALEEMMRNVTNPPPGGHDSTKRRQVGPPSVG